MSTPLNCDPCYGTLAIDDVDLFTAWCCTPDLSVLWGTPAIRGDDRVIPGTPGVDAMPRLSTATRYSLRLLVTGQYDRTGMAVDESQWPRQLESNMAWLMTELLLPPGTDPGLRQADWTLPSGTVVSADVHVLGISAPVIGVQSILRTTLEISNPGADLHL